MEHEPMTHQPEELEELAYEDWVLRTILSEDRVLRREPWVKKLLKRLEGVPYGVPEAMAAVNLYDDSEEQHQ